MYLKENWKDLWAHAINKLNTAAKTFKLIKTDVQGYLKIKLPEMTFLKYDKLEHVYKLTSRILNKFSSF